jgi:hypothetical protein
MVHRRSAAAPGYRRGAGVPGVLRRTARPALGRPARDHGLAADQTPSLFVVIELSGCHDIRLGGPNDDAMDGHPLYGKGLAAYEAHEVLNSEWIEQAIKVNSVHPQHSAAPVPAAAPLRPAVS